MRLRGIRVSFRVWKDQEDVLARCDECGETMDAYDLGEHVHDCRGDAIKAKAALDAEYELRGKGQ